MIDKIAPYWKAVVAFVVPAAVTLTNAVTESSAGGTERPRRSRRGHLTQTSNPKG